ncbi:MAG: RNA polymerase sigma factor [Clostridiales bacterium]|jgi:RNA polymerase sigma factor (sigma-70 family)|nr:RNA polymerase sigma factor [Clostridiales bacterium]
MDNGASSYRRFLNGDEDAFVEIVEQYGANLILFINGFVRNIVVAEDLMEETFCDLIFYKNRYKEKSSFKTYLFAIARNKAATYLKKNSRIADLPIEDYEGQLKDMNALENTVIKEEEKRQLYSAMDKINSEYHAVLYLLYFEKMSYDEAALVLKKNNKQIKNLAYRGKQALKSMMEKGGFFYEKQ